MPEADFPEFYWENLKAETDRCLAELTAFINSLKGSAVDQRFVIMETPDVWFDRNVAGIFPQLDKCELPIFQCNEKAELGKLKITPFYGLPFALMTPAECQMTFVNGNGNPYLDLYGNLRYVGHPTVPSQPNAIITEDYDGYGDNCSKLYYTDRDTPTYQKNCDRLSCTSTALVIPVFRLLSNPVSAGQGKATEALRGKKMNLLRIVLSWMLYGFVPQGLNAGQHERYLAFVDFCRQFGPYLLVQGETLFFYAADAKEAVLHGEAFQTIQNGQKPYVGRLDGIKRELRQCDWKRANLAPYTEKQLTDINLGHWEIFENHLWKANPDICRMISLSAGELLVARPPQMDIMNGTCGIDFGTKSTVVACRNQEERLLRVGKGDYTKAPALADYENPTVIELRDVAAFAAVYRERDGRPYTEWEQVTVSHQAAEAIFQNDDDSSVYYAVFSELKQWANDKDRRLMLRDRKGKLLEVKPYLELVAGDFDPIELYAYYLGLYINNMYNGIYLDYILSFPVNYEKNVREKLRQSFERGLRKTLPPAILHDAAVMERFRVYAGASEPVAYAISALQEFHLEPKQAGELVYYAVFDFGGGTTDFDFGTEEVPANHRRKFVIHQFGNGGDPYLGGENILDSLAYEVFKDNIEVMRAKRITFALPPQSIPLAGAETLVYDGRNASQQAYMNRKRLTKLLRPIWERQEGYEKLFSNGSSAIHLFAAEAQEGSDTQEVQLKVDVKKLEAYIEQRIKRGVENFFVALLHAFKGKFKEKEACRIHIFLAGNSCKSPVVKQLFDAAISEKEKEIEKEVRKAQGQEKDASGCFILHLPMGQQAEQEMAGTTVEYDRLRTGKTGVAFGLLRSRIGGKDVQIINSNVDQNDEVHFPYFLGNLDETGKFQVKIGLKIPYGAWAFFTYADESEFELYYTREPKALDGQIDGREVRMLRCPIDARDISEEDDVGVYLRKAGPDSIEYAVGRASDFSADELTKKIYQEELKG